MYAKIFSQIYDSSIADDWQVRVVFEDLLVLANSEGIVDMTPQAIAARTRIPQEIIDRALVALQSPDPKSRTPDEDGKRLVLLNAHRDWGWQIVNYEKYRGIKCEFDRRTYMRKYMRSKRKGVSKTRKTVSLTPSNKTFTSPSSSTSPSASSVRGGQHQTFIKQWSDNFKDFHRFDYTFDGAKDGKAVKELLGKGIMVVDLHEIAKKAWARNKKDGEWNCKQATTIFGFANRFNQIRVEVQNGEEHHNGNF